MPRDVYDSWDNIDFKDRFCLTRENLYFRLNRIPPYIEKAPTNILPTPM